MKAHCLKSFSFYLSLIALTNSSGCKNDTPCADEELSKTEYFSISETNKSKIPYRTDGLDTLVYISESGDSAVWLGQGKANYYETAAINRNSNPDCPFYDYKYFETIQFGFKNKFINDISLIEIKYYTEQSSIVREQFSANINNNEYGTYLTTVNHELSYTDSVLINGTTYYGMILNGSNDSQIIYNFRFGILQFTLNNKKWKLKR